MDAMDPALMTGGAVGVVAILFYVVNLCRSAPEMHAELLADVGRIERERDQWREKAERRAADQHLADALSELRHYGLHEIRNRIDTEPERIEALVAQEAEWRKRIEAAMKASDCPSSDVSLVMDFTNTQIGLAAIGADFGPRGNWLVGLLECRLTALGKLIEKYAP